MSNTRSNINNDSNQLKQPSPSSKKLVQEEQEFNLNIWDGNSKVLESVMSEYAFEPKSLEQPIMFWPSSLEQEILTLAYYAAPFEQIEKYIRKAYARKEKHLRDTLVNAAVSAIHNCDITLQDEKGMIVEGMAEKLMALHDELYSSEMKCIDKVIPKLSFENEKEKRNRENANKKAITQIFEAIAQNDPQIDTEIEKFKKFVESTTPFNRIHLLFVAFAILDARGSNLPAFLPSFGFYGQACSRFCIEVIGNGIQRDLPPRIQQLLKMDLHFILKKRRGELTREFEEYSRKLDVEGLSFLGVESDTELGRKSYFDIFGRAIDPCGGRRQAWSSTAKRVFHTLLRVYTAAFAIYEKANSMTPGLEEARETKGNIK